MKKILMHKLQEVPGWLLDERARHLSLPIGAGAENDLSLITFIVGKTKLGLPLKDLLEVVKIQAITWVPSAPHFVRGVFQLLDGAVTALDLGVIIGEKPLLKVPIALVISEDKKTGEDKKAGLLTNSFSQVAFPANLVTPFPPHLAPHVQRWCNEVIWDRGELIAIMNKERFFLSPEIQKLGGGF